MVKASPLLQERFTEHMAVPDMVYNYQTAGYEGFIIVIKTNEKSQASLTV